jgi:hypothetical protein
MKRLQVKEMKYIPLTKKQPWEILAEQMTVINKALGV